MKRTVLFLVSLFWIGAGLGAQSWKTESERNISIQNARRINSDGMDFAPMFYRNGLVWVSSRNKMGPVDRSTGETFFDLYFAESGEQEMPGRPKAFSLELNSPWHENAVTFSRSEDQIFFTRTNSRLGLTLPDDRGRINLKIYSARLGNFDWEQVEELPFNDDTYSCMHPSLSADGSRLFFSSDRPGGYGGRDLYFVEKQGEKWSIPINMGPEVNTPKDEVFPFIHESGTLFFSSDGHTGFGGMDLFMIDISNRTWGQVINLGGPFNSSDDDVSFILDRGATTGFFASSREGGVGKLDIYRFEAPFAVFELQASGQLKVPVKVIEMISQRELASSAVRIFDHSPEGSAPNPDLYDVELSPSGGTSSDLAFRPVRKPEEELEDPRYITDRNGEVFLELDPGKDYIILVSKPGYETREIDYSTKGITEPAPLEISLLASTCMTLHGVVWSEPYNRPVPNASIRIRNGCTGQEVTVYSNFNGRFTYCLDPGCDFFLTGEKEGYQSGTSKVSTVKIRGNYSLSAEIRLTPQSEDVIKEPIREGTVIVLEDIYFDFGETVARQEDNQALNALVDLMDRYPSMEIELGAHTDSRGTAQFNLQLSLRRAESVRAFLIQQGIAPERIKAFGYGESKPRNRCVDGVECTEEEHLYNRRTEIKITRIEEPLEYRYEKAKGGLRKNE